MFIDTAKIFVKSGKGGNGAVTFRREKFVPLGGPDGGDGGKGGDVILEVDENMTTLLDYSYRRKYVAEDGKNGSGSKCYGRNGENKVLKVPLGTIVKNADDQKIMADLSHVGDKYVVAKGGKGGKGNAKFCTPTRHTPEFAEPGMPSEDRWITFELKLLADVGLVGFPNAGKSTILSMVTRAKPKIANYPFTTLKPNLGVVDMQGVKSFVIADIPGIIEGASEGAGLGLDFLRHIERTRILIHVVDLAHVDGRDPLNDFIKINEELKKYNSKLAGRPQIVAANKADLLESDSDFEKFKSDLKKMGYEKVFKISAATGEGIKLLMHEANKMLQDIPVADMEISPEEMYVPEEKRFTYTIRKEENTFIIEGSFADRLLESVNVNNPNSLRYFHKVLKNKGIMDELLKMGIKDGDTVKFSYFEFEYVL